VAQLGGLFKGLGVTFRTLLKPAVTVQYPHEKEAPPNRARGVIALKEENCTVCMLCGRSCPDWCIYIEGHKEKRPPRREGGRPRTVNVIDRFDIDYALCMYCGICVEVCPFDALFWSPEFEYAEYDIHSMTHEKDRLEEWTYKVLPPPALEVGAEPPPETAPPSPASPQAPAASVPTAEAATAGTDVQAPSPSPAAAEAAVPARAPSAPRIEVEPDQQTFDRVLAEQLAKGTDRRIAEGRAKSAALKAARAAAEPEGSPA
jgi:NADH-quinone oxidoreductase subunit I